MIKYGQKINTSNSDTKYWITSDLHFYHNGVLRFCPDTRPWKDVDEMNAALIGHWNSVVGVEDEVISLGDFSFKGREATETIINQLNGNITWVAGNHCRKVLGAIGVPFYDYLEFKFNGVKLCMMHYPIKHWNECDHGSLMLHGHCVDTLTEILTPSGWKKFNQISKGDSIISYNFTTKEMELDTVLDYHLVENYQGDTYTNESRTFSFCGTSNHRLVGLTLQRKYKDITVEDYTKTTTKMKMIRCGVLPSVGLSLTDDQIRLYICLVADGNITPSGLGRFPVYKEYKLKYFRGVLGRLNIKYTENKHKNGGSCINFRLPDYLTTWNIKGLDEKIMDCNKEQVVVILEAYEITDGYRPRGGKSTIIYIPLKK